MGARNNTNIQESALLIAMHKVGMDRELYLENYWLKNQPSVDKGENMVRFSVVDPGQPAAQGGRRGHGQPPSPQGLEIHRADAAFSPGNLEVAPGDYLIRADQPYRTMADMYLSVQNYPPWNPRPYDDTGWTMQYMRNVKVTPVREKAILDHSMTMLSTDARADGGIDGWGATLLMEHTTDNALMAFRFRNKELKMLVAEEDLERAGANGTRGRSSFLTRTGRGSSRS